VHVDFRRDQLGIAVPVEVVEHDLTGSGQALELEMMVVVAEADSLFGQLGAHGFEDADQGLDPLDSVAVFRRRRTEGGEIAAERLEPVDQRSRVALQRVQALVGGAAEEVVAVELTLDDVGRERGAGDLHRLVADGANFVERLVKIAFRLAVVAQVEERHRNLAVRSFHDGDPFFL